MLISQHISRDLIRLLVIFALVKTGVHLYTNIFAGYGIFRDELYYFACAEHLDYGYVDHPPLSVWILALVTSVLGDSLFAIRLFPALLSGLSIFMIGLTTAELGGKKIAVSIVCIALLVSGIHLSYSTFYSMNVFDLTLWSVAIFLTVRLIKTQERVYWIYLGVALGLALLNKIGALFYGAGLFVALLATDHRKWFTAKWPYLTGLISLALFSPYILWNMQHDWAHLEFIHNASTQKYGGLSPATFWSGQLLINNPVTLPVSLAGLVYVFTEKNKAYRFMFIIFLVVATILTINRTSKPEYLASIFPVLLAGGALQFEQWSANRKWIGYATLVLLATGVMAFPLALPILPAETYIRYAAAVGIQGENSEGHSEGPLPQFYADMFGWEEKAAAMANAYHALSLEEQKVCTLFGENYGRAGAIDYYADKYSIPKSIGGHNSYWIWGPGKATGEIVLVLSRDVGDKKKLFEQVEDLGPVPCTYCMPYENNLHLYLCRGLKKPIDELWPQVKGFI